MAAMAKKAFGSEVFGDENAERRKLDIDLILPVCTL
jgi:hypothetical protein